MNTKLLAVLLLMLSILPTALGQYTPASCIAPTICITTEALSGPVQLFGQSGQTWTWTAQPGFFNFSTVTNGSYANDSLTHVYIMGRQDQIISDSTSYSWKIFFRDSITTHTILATADYTRFGWFTGWDPFPHATAQYSFVYDGVTILPAGKGVNWNTNPAPSFVFNMQRRPTDANASLFHDTNRSVDNANSLLGFTYPEVKIDDVYGGTGGGGSTTTTSGTNAFPLGLIPEAQGFTLIPITNFTQFSELPSLQMGTSQGTELQAVTYQFQKAASEAKDIADKAAEGAAQVCSFDINFGIFHFCISSLLEGIWNFLVNIITYPISWILSIIPGFDGVRQFVLSIIATVFGYFRLVSTILFSAGPNYPPSGIFIALIALASAFSFPVWAITGSFSFVWKFPFLFVKWLLKGTYYFGKFILIDITVSVVTMFADMIP